MADRDRAIDDPMDQLWDQLGRVHAGMLGIEDSAKHPQPMTPQLDRAEGTIWFFAHTEAELVRAVGIGARAQFVLVGRDHDYYASLSGPIVQNPREDKIDAFWGPGIAAWYPDGRADGSLTLLEMTLQEASVWAVADDSLTRGWELARANLTSHQPHLSVRQQIQF